MVKKMKIGNTQIGLNHPPYIIAEIGVNHDGEVERALELTDAAAEAGADAIKLQFFETDRLMSKAAKLAAYQKNAGETDPIEMLRRLELTIDEMALVVERAHAKGIHAIVTVFSTELVPIAETLPWDAYKTASPDIINYPLIEALIETGKPLIVSTGACERHEVADMYFALIEHTDRCAFLQCVSSYPTPAENASIASMHDVPDDIYLCGGAIGYSDHTAQIDTGAIAVSIGANILEKHFTYNRSASGPDHTASLEPTEFAEYVRLAKNAPKPPTTVRSERIFGIPFWKQKWTVVDLQQVELMSTQDPRIGQVEKQIQDCERDVRSVSRQSIVSTRDIPAGTTITKEMLTIKRPGTGIPPYKLNQILGSKTTQPIEADTPITEADIN
ncbi:MAG: N-acetylneuraminate synthase family protein [Phycisphaerales bacterium]|nr:N-acetylneuraminate synthase family protein [Phycisphaerales bacterium]